MGQSPSSGPDPRFVHAALYVSFVLFGSDVLSAQPYLVPSDGISVDDGHGGDDNFSDAEDNNVFGSVFLARDSWV